MKNKRFIIWGLSVAAFFALMYVGDGRLNDARWKCINASVNEQTSIGCATPIRGKELAAKYLLLLGVIIAISFVFRKRIFDKKD